MSEKITKKTVKRKGVKTQIKVYKNKNIFVSKIDKVLYLLYSFLFTCSFVILNESYQSNHTLSFLDIISMNFFEENINGRLDKFKVESFSGKASYSNFSKEQIESKKISLGLVLKAGDTVETGEGAFVVLAFGETFNSYLKIGENSKMVLDLEESFNEDDKMKNKNISLVLKVGSLLFDIVDKYDLVNFRIKSKRNIVKINKAKFLTNADESENISIVVAKGKLAVLDVFTKKTKEILDGFGITFFKDGMERRLNIKKLGIQWNLFKNNKGKLMDTNLLAKQNKRFSSKGIDTLRSKLAELEKLGTIQEKVEGLRVNFKLNLKELAKLEAKTLKIISILERNLVIVQKRINQTNEKEDNSKLITYKRKLELAKAQLVSVEKRIDAGNKLMARLANEDNGSNTQEKLAVLMHDYQRIYTEILSQQANTIKNKGN